MGSERTAVCGMCSFDEWSMVGTSRPYSVCWYSSTVVEHELLTAKLREKLPPGTQLFGCRECLCRSSGFYYYWLIVLLPDGCTSRFEEEIQSVVEELDDSSIEAVEPVLYSSRVCFNLDASRGHPRHPRVQFTFCEESQSGARFMAEYDGYIRLHWLRGHFCGRLFDWFGQMEFRETRGLEKQLLRWSVKSIVCTHPERVIEHEE